MNELTEVTSDALKEELIRRGESQLPSGIVATKGGQISLTKAILRFLGSDRGSRFTLSYEANPPSVKIVGSTRGESDEDQIH